MSSEYSYATLANVEDYTGIDYSTVDSVRFADGKVLKKITITERMINAYLGVSTAQTVTDSIKMCTIVIAAKMLHDSMKELGYHEGIEHKESMYLAMNEAQMLDFFLNRDTMVDSIPMSGASYHKPDSRMF